MDFTTILKKSKLQNRMNSYSMILLVCLFKAFRIMEGDKISYQWLLFLGAPGLCYAAWAPELKGLVVVARGHGCPAAWGILVSGLGIKPTSCAMEGLFSTTGLPGKSLTGYFCSWKKLRGKKILLFIYSFLQSFCKV